MTATIIDFTRARLARSGTAAIRTLVPSDPRVIAACHAQLEATRWEELDTHAHEDKVERGLMSPAAALNAIRELLEAEWQLTADVVGERRATIERGVPQLSLPSALDVNDAGLIERYGAAVAVGVLRQTLREFRRRSGPDAGWGESWIGVLGDAIERIFLAYRKVVNPYLAAEGFDPARVILKPAPRAGDRRLVIEVFPNTPDYFDLAEPTEGLYAELAFDRAEGA